MSGSLGEKQIEQWCLLNSQALLVLYYFVCLMKASLASLLNYGSSDCQFRFNSLISRKSFSEIRNKLHSWIAIKLTEHKEFNSIQFHKIESINGSVEMMRSVKFEAFDWYGAYLGNSENE